MKDITRLALERIRELGQEAFSIHEDISRWRDPPLADLEKARMSVRLKNAIEKQCEWVLAIQESEGEDDE